jgi:hypothetical protein
MPIIAAPIPKKILKKRIEAKSGAKNVPKAPTPKSAIPSVNNDLCLNLTVKKPMAKPTIKPTNELMVKIWLAVPTVTFSDEATFTMALLKKTSNVKVKNIPKSKAGTNNWLLRLFLTADCGKLMFSIIYVTNISDYNNYVWYFLDFLLKLAHDSRVVA